MLGRKGDYFPPGKLYSILIEENINQIFNKTTRTLKQIRHKSKDALRWFDQTFK